MHQALRVVVPFDPEIERTIRRQRRSTLQVEGETHHREEISIELLAIEPMVEQKANKRALRDFALPGTQGA